MNFAPSTIDAMPSSLAGVAIPDSQLAQEITELVRDTEAPLLFDHLSRVYYWGRAHRQAPRSPL
jgi:hypothetical protein